MDIFVHCVKRYPRSEQLRAQEIEKRLDKNFTETLLSGGLKIFEILKINTTIGVS